MKVWVCERRLIVPAPAILFVASDEEVARELVKRVSQEFQALAQCHLVDATGQDHGSLKDFLGLALGVQSVGHPVLPVEVKESSLVVAENRIIKPN